MIRTSPELFFLVSCLKHLAQPFSFWQHRYSFPGFYASCLMSVIKIIPLVSNLPWLTAELALRWKLRPRSMAGTHGPGVRWRSPTQSCFRVRSNIWQVVLMLWVIIIVLKPEELKCFCRQSPPPQPQAFDIRTLKCPCAYGRFITRFRYKRPSQYILVTSLMSSRGKRQPAWRSI